MEAQVGPMLVQFLIVLKGKTPVTKKF